MRTMIVNGRLILPDGHIRRGGLLLEDEHIARIFEGDCPEIAGAEKMVDAQEKYVSPGFVDLHVHGGGGYDFMDGTPEAMIGASKAHMLGGTTALLPTTVAAGNDELLAVQQSYRAVRDAGLSLPELLGLHLEGPYLSHAQAGAQDPAYLRIPQEEDVHALLDLCPDMRRMTAACELPGALALGDVLTKRGILASIGHSDATYAQVSEAIGHGYRHVTHLYSGMSCLHRERAIRVLGVTESAYLEDELTVEIIADGKHLPPELLRLIVRSKPHDSICLITDSMRGAGMPDGSRTVLGSKRAGQQVVIEDGVAYMPDHSCFAGSVATADRCVRTMHEACGLSLGESVQMMTQNPCRIMGIDGRKGRLQEGYDADIVIFGEHVQIDRVYVRGQMTVCAGILL